MSPARLGKEDNKNYSFFDILNCKIEAWLIRHATFCFVVMFVLLSVLFVLLIFALTGVSATESGTVYNHFDKIV